MRVKVLALLAVLFVPVVCCICYADDVASKVIPRGAKIFIAPMPDGFHEYLKAAIEKKKVPVAVVEDKSSAQFEITGQSDTQKASTAKKVIMWNWRSNEQASIQVNNLETSAAVFAYSVNKISSAHGKQSTAEACAKHLKEKIESGK
jgi:hypothetical protein